MLNHLPTTHSDFTRRMDKIKKRERMNPTATPLIAARNMFQDALGLYEDLPYEQWLAMDPEDKAAALYVQFFQQISLAWFKARSFYCPEEDGVSIVLQYLQKNVAIIEADERRYKPGYVYRVAYNCMFCQARDIKRDREAFENETSNICDGVDGADTDIFNYLIGRDFSEVFEGEIARRQLWYTIERMGDDVVAYVNGILSGDNVPKKIRDRSDDILKDLQKNLARFYNTEF